MPCEATHPGAAHSTAGVCLCWCLCRLALPRARHTAAHCCALAPALTDRPMQTGAPASIRLRRAYRVGSTGEHRQLLWCAPSLPGFVAETETLHAPRTDRRCACIGLLTLMACAAWCCCPRLGIQLLQEELVPGPPCLLLTVAPCVVLWTGRGPSCSVGKFMCVPLPCGCCALSAAF